VLKVAGISGWDSGLVDDVEGGGGIGICSSNVVKGLAKLSLFHWPWQLLAAGSCCSAAVEAVGLIVGGVGEEFGWFGIENGFGMSGLGSLSSEQKAIRSLLKQAAKAGWSSVGASSRY